jgi:hypothetical protein
VGKYFSLFFIPIFKISELGEYVQCVECKKNFKPEVLDVKPITPEQRHILMVQRDIESGTPLQMAQTKLINAGMDAKAAAQIVDQATPEEVRECEACQLTYSASITKCSICGEQLSFPKLLHQGSVFDIN